MCVCVYQGWENWPKRLVQKKNHLGVSHLFFEGPTACSVGQITHCSPC